jgi:hypothetical protein
VNEVTTAPQFAAERRASLFVFPSSTEPVLGNAKDRKVDAMNETAATEIREPSELRATFLLFALVLLIPMMFGIALFGLAGH